MGNINFFNLAELKKRNNAKYFVETGTYMGSSVAHAAHFGFEKCYTIELDKKYIPQALENLKSFNNIELLEGSSHELLEKLVETIDGNIIFWLDAHFPFSYESGVHEYEGDHDIFVPLEREIKSLTKRKNKYQDIILIDDMRCYIDKIDNVTSFEDHFAIHHNQKLDRKKLIKSDEKFIYDAFSDTHDITLHSTGEGYLSIIPKGL